MQKIKELSELCDARERYKLVRMIKCAADYISAVTVMETTAINIQHLEGDDFREERSDTDRARTAAHNDFISSVNTVNAICDAHGVERVYTGSGDRRAYGDYAFKLISEIFTNRH